VIRLLVYFVARHLVSSSRFLATGVRGIYPLLHARKLHLRFMAGQFLPYYCLGQYALSNHSNLMTDLQQDIPGPFLIFRNFELILFSDPILMENSHRWEARKQRYAGHRHDKTCNILIAIL